MRKIESLQENERVFVKSNQWREAAKLFNFCAMPLDDIFVGKNEVGYFWETTITSASKLYKLKDFLPNKKSKTKQRLKALESIVKELQEQKNTAAIRFDYDKGCLTTEPKDEPKLEVLPEKWYNHEAGGVVYIVKIENERVYIYGFNSAGHWFDDTSMIINYLKYLTPATDKEVEEALINEAKRRGFIEGNFKCLDGDYNELVSKDYNEWTYDVEANALFTQPYMQGGQCVFDNGKWATILDQTKEIDFSVAGQYVVNNHGAVMLTSGKQRGNYFEATVIKSKFERHPNGTYLNELLKDSYTLLTEPITINPQP